MTSESAAKDLRYCAEQGSLVGLQHWLPSEPFDYDWGRNNPQIGCNHIRCSRCRQRVTVTPISEFSRRYQCRCTQYDEDKQTWLSPNPDGEYRGLSALENPPPHTWACAGHPAFQVPSMLDGVRISAEDFREVARVGFATPPFEPPGTTGHSIWVSRLYWILPASLRPLLGNAVSELVLDEDPRIAVRAMLFYYEQRTAEGSERLTMIARQHGARLAEITDPDHPGYTLENALLTALELRGFRRGDSGELLDPEAHDVLRRAMRAGKNPNDVIYTFGRLEPEWLAANAAEIVKNAPTLLGDVVWLLRKQPHELRQGAYRAISELSAGMRDELYKRIEAEFNGDERDKILSRLDRSE